MRYLTLISCFIGSSAAAGAPVTWGELMAPERLVHSFSQSAILAARSFVEFTYSEFDIDLRRNSFTMRNIKAYPEVNAYPKIDGYPVFSCAIEARRVDLVGAGLARPDDLDLTLRADDVRIRSGCLPPPFARELEQAGLEVIHLPRTVIHMSYNVPSAATQVTGYVVADDLVELSFNLDLDYFWLNAYDEEAFPVAYFTRGDVSLRNLGVWDLAQNFVPPQMRDPEHGPAGVQMAVDQALNDVGAPSAFAADLAAQMGQAWSEFLSKPEQLSIALAPSAPVFLDMETVSDNPPGEVLAVLSPKVAAGPIALVKALPAETLKAALGAPESLSTGERLQAGRQLLTGVGAPKNVSAGLALLLPLAQAGDEQALNTLAKLSKDGLRAEDYTALAEAAVNQPDVAAVLDALEVQIGFAQTLAMQPPLEFTTSYQGITSSQDLRERAFENLNGSRSPRSYARAAYWAQLAVAAGDAIAADILADIAGRAVSDEDKAAWGTLNDAAAKRALDDWIAVDIPSRLSAE